MNKQKKPLYYYYLIILIVLLGINLVFTMFRGDKIKNVNYNDFMKQIEQHQINEVEIGDQNITYSLKGETKQLYKTERWKQIRVYHSAYMMPELNLRVFIRKK